MSRLSQEGTGKGFPAGKLSQLERTLELANRFLEEVRRDIERAAAESMDTPPRLRSVQERKGHATPEYRTMVIPAESLGGASPEVLSGTIARYAADKSPTHLLLTLSAEMQGSDGRVGPVLIAEARDRSGNRLFWMQPYRVRRQRVEWDDPREGGWQDPGAEEMILDAAFQPAR